MRRISVRLFSYNELYMRTGFKMSDHWYHIKSFRNLTLYHINCVDFFNYMKMPTCLSYKSNQKEDGLQQPLMLLYMWLTLFKSPNDIKAIWEVDLPQIIVKRQLFLVFYLNYLRWRRTLFPISDCTKRYHLLVFRLYGIW